MLDVEGYFIQLLFCRSRDLLKRENRGLYDAFFARYCSIFQEIPKSETRLEIINNKFLLSLGVK